MQAIIFHANGVGIVFAVDSNARSTSWHDDQTNKSGKAMKEILISRQLNIANEESCRTKFWSIRGARNIKLRVQNKQAKGLISGWAIHDKESCSGHKIIKYGLGNANTTTQRTGNNRGGIKYIVQQRDIAKFQRALYESWRSFKSE